VLFGTRAAISKVALAESAKTSLDIQLQGTGKDEVEIMKQQILDECFRRGTCPLDRKQFDESFTGRDLTIQVRSAIDFAQQNGLAFGRSSGDQHFVFSRLAALPEVDTSQRRRPPRNSNRRADRRPQGQQKARGSSNRPFGRSF
jgi:hypothetical protein